MPAVPDLPWRELHRSLRAFVGRRVRNHADVDDLVQRVLLQIVAGLGSLRNAERLHAWIYRTARNVIADYYRLPARRREVPGGDTADLASAHREAELAPIEDDDRTALRELAACLSPMLQRLPASYQEALRLTDLEGVTQAEAARRAGVSLSGMKSRVQRGRQQLRALVEACCRVELDQRGTVWSFTPRRPDGCCRSGCT